MNLVVVDNHQKYKKYDALIAWVDALDLLQMILMSFSVRAAGSFERVWGNFHEFDDCLRFWMNCMFDELGIFQ